MPIEVTCACGHRFRAEDAFANQDVPCPACQDSVRVAGSSVTAFDVFVSYSSKDKAVADAAVATLEAHGLRCWIAPRDIVPGKEWGEAIIDGINQCRMLVLIFSANSNNSQQVLREVERAVNRGMPILPFRIEDLRPSKGMEYFISSRHWLDAYHPPLDAHLDRLATTCHTLLTSTSGPGARPDAQVDHKSFIRSAVRSLLARDHRTRLLVALTLACLLIGGLVVVSMYLMRDPKAPADVIEAKVSAESAVAETQKATAGLGIDAEVQALDNALKTGQSHFDQKQFEQAKSAFQEVARRAGEVQALCDMKKSRAAFEEVKQRIGSPGVNGPGSWTESEGLAHTAEEQKQFVNASRLYQEAQARFEKQAIPQMHYLCFWAGYAPRVIVFARLGDVANERVRKLGGFVFDGAPFPTRDDISQAFSIFKNECVPQLRLDSELSDIVITEKDADKVFSAADKLGGLLQKKFGKDAQKWYALGFHVASVTGFLEHHTRIGTEITPYPYLKYEDYFHGPMKAMLDVAFLAQRLELPREVRDALVEAAFFYTHMSETEIEFGYARACRQFRPCLVRYRRFASQWLKDSKQAVAFLSKSPLPATTFGDEQWKNIIARSEQGVSTLIFPNDKGTRVSWVFAPRVKPETDLVAYIATLPPPYRIDLGSGDDPGPAGAVADQLSKYPTLQELSIRCLPMSEARMTQVGKLSGLRMLTLWNIGPEKPETLAPLAQLQELRWLSLSDQAINDDALAHLAGLKNLEELYVAGKSKEITSKGLAHLKGLTNLKVFVASGVDRKDVDAFKAEMPNLAPKKKPGK